MKLKQLTRYSDNLIKGRTAETLPVCVMLFGTEIFFRLLETLLCSIVIYSGNIPPLYLFYSGKSIQSAALFLCNVMRKFSVTTVIYASAYRFSEISDGTKGKNLTPLLHMTMNRRFFRRSLSVSVIVWTISAAFMFPVLFFGKISFMFLTDSINLPEEISIPVAVHSAAMVIISACIWIWAKIGLSAVPFLTAQFPDKKPLRIVCESFGFMKCRRKSILKIYLRYIPLMIPIVTIPYIMPKLFAAVSLFVNISIREDEYIGGNKTESRFRKSRNSAEFSDKSGHFTPTSHKTETS